MRIREIRNSQEFQDFCQQLLAAEHDDFQEINDSGGDSGNDGYVPSKGRLYAIYCPETQPNPKEYYQRKIRDDAQKAAAWRDKHGLPVNEWVFVTPVPLSDELTQYVSKKAQENGVPSGIVWSEKRLQHLFTKHSHLRVHFPHLAVPDISAQVEKSHADIITIKDMMSQFVATGGSPQVAYASRLAQSYDRRLNTAKQQLEEGELLRAKQEAEAVLHDLNEETTLQDPTLKAKALSTIAVCEWQEEHFERAAELFEEAHHHAPDDKKYIGNLASAKLLRGETELALEIVDRALEMDPNDTNTITIKANILFRLGREDEAIDLLEDKGKPNLHLYFMGLRSLAEQNFIEAEADFRRLLELEPNNTQCKEYIAQTILQQMQYVLHQVGGSPRLLPGEALDSFEEAQRLLTEVIERYSTQGLTEKLSGPYTNRAAARLILGNTEEALADSIESVKLDPTNGLGYLNKSKAELILGRPEAAAESIDRYIEFSTPATVRWKDIVYLYYMAGRIEKAKAIVLREIQNEFAEDDLAFAELAVEVLELGQDYEAAESLLDRLSEQFPDNSWVLLARARHLRNRGEGQVEEVLRSAIANGGDAALQIAKHNLSHFLYSQRRYEEARSLYRELLTADKGDPVNYNYLVCLFYTHKYREILEFAARMRGDVAVDKEISPIEAAALKALMRFDEAAELYLKLFQQTPSEIGYLVEYGGCLFRRGRGEEALKVFNRVKKQVNKVKDLVALATGFSLLGDPLTAIELCHAALYSAFDNSRLHLFYINLYLKRDKAQDNQIDEKYRQTFKDVTDNFKGRFPDEDAFEVIQVGNNLEGLVERIDRMDVSSTAILQQYQEGLFPISTVAAMKGRNLFSTYAFLTSSPELGFRCSIGDVEEQKRESVTALNANRIAIDLLALFTLARCKRLGLLTKVFGPEVYVHQSVLDELLIMLRDEKEVAQEGFNTIGKEGGKLVRVIVPPDPEEKSVKFLQEITSFVRNSCQVVGFSRELTEEEIELEDFVGTSSAHSAVLAAQREVAFLSDDEALRRVAKEGLNVEGFPTYLLFDIAARRKHIHWMYCYEEVIKLLGWNYRYIPVNAGSLMYCAQKSGYRGGGAFDLALEHLGRAETTIESLTGVLAEFVLRVWPQLSYPLDSSVLNRVLRAATKHHPYEATAIQFITRLLEAKAFPLALRAEMQRLAGTWFKKNFVPPNLGLEND